MEEIYPYKMKYLMQDRILSTENYIYVRMEYGKNCDQYTQSASTELNVSRKIMQVLIVDGIQ